MSVYHGSVAACQHVRSKLLFFACNLLLVGEEWTCVVSGDVCV